MGVDVKTIRIGIDLGGTKTEGIAMGADGVPAARKRIETPRNDYDATIGAIKELVAELGQAGGGAYSVGVGMPGSIAPRSGLVQNANSTWLNGRPFARDLAAAIGQQVACANDANCFALSEALDGAGAGTSAGGGTVFGVILGTGCGGGLVHSKALIDGPRGIGGEWGHNPLPWAGADEHPGPLCWCGRRGCMETFVSGPALALDHCQNGGANIDAEAIALTARGGDDAALAARACLERHASRLARGLAHVVNLFDPDLIVLGGGLSKLRHLYEVLPGLMAPYIFADDRAVEIRPPKWGDASGVRGAARLWD